LELYAFPTGWGSAWRSLWETPGAERWLRLHWRCGGLQRLDRV